MAVRQVSRARTVTSARRHSVDIGTAFGPIEDHKRCISGQIRSEREAAHLRPLSTCYEDGSYLAANPTWGAEEAAWKADQIAALLSDSLFVPRSICDFGCGTGRLLKRLHTLLGEEVRLAGVDISPQAIARAREVENAQLHFVVGTLPPVDEAPYDLLLLIDVFEHVEDYLGFLRRLRGFARHFVFHIPLDLHVSSVARGAPLLATRGQVGHLHYFTRETALATLADAGYRVLEERYTAAGLEPPGRRLRARLAALPRRLVFTLSPHLAARWLGGFSLLVFAEPTPDPIAYRGIQLRSQLKPDHPKIRYCACPTTSTVSRV